jgi:preprotein translocase subunit SecB
MLAPVNFDALYRQALAQEAAKANEAPAATEDATH